MGNRAIVIFTDDFKDVTQAGPAVYFHWNGGPESILAFLYEMDRRGIRSGDTAYETARFIQGVGDWMDQDNRKGLSLGVMERPTSFQKIILRQFSHGDNGVYLVNRALRRWVRATGWGEDFKIFPPQTFEEAEATIRKDDFGNEYLDGIAETFRTIDDRLYTREPATT